MSTFGFEPFARQDLNIAETLGRLVDAGMSGGGVTLTPEELHVTLGEPTLFDATIPRSSIAKAERIPDLKSATRGIHGAFGKWLVNTSSRNLVRLTMKPPARAHVHPLPLLPEIKANRVIKWLMRDRTIRLRQLTISVSSPDEFLASLKS